MRIFAGFCNSFSKNTLSRRAGIKTKSYHLRLVGLRENDGEISAKTLQSILDALLVTAERATRLLVTGESLGRGIKPQWLKSSIDFKVTGLQPGSTVLELGAPLLGDAAPHVFAQRELWNELPSTDESALDVTSSAIKEALTTDSAGDRFDYSVLEAIQKFKSALSEDGSQLELTGKDNSGCRISLNNKMCDRLQERARNIPSPRAFIVSGFLEEVQYSSGKFRLLIDSGTKLLGMIDPKIIDIEILRSLWGNQTTIEGIVGFKSNGQPRFIKAQRVLRIQKGDSLFEELPFEEKEGSRSWVKNLDEHARNFDPLELADAWPGDESLEELMENLD